MKMYPGFGDLNPGPIHAGNHRPSWLLYGRQGNFHPIPHVSVGSKISIRPLTSAHCIAQATIVRRGRWKAQTQAVGSLLCSVNPKTTLSECRAYLYNIDPTNNPYSNSQVHRAENLLGLKWKAASTTADLAFLPQNMTLQEYYWTEPPPAWHERCSHCGYH
jgi:hypothetical protein